MKEHHAVLQCVLMVLVLALLQAPGSAGLVIAEEGAPVTDVTGETSVVIGITDTAIGEGGTLEIDVSTLRYGIATNTLADENIAVTTSAADPVVWTAEIDESGDLVRLVSYGGPTLDGETITVTFRGTAGNPWSPDLIDVWFPVPVTRTDTFETVEFTFAINTPASVSGLMITDGEIITTPAGATSAVITILDSPIGEDGTITIGTENLGVFLAMNLLTDASVEVTSSAPSPVLWTRSVSPDGTSLTLTSTGGGTDAGGTVTVTFSGAADPWLPGTGGATLTATRDDTGGTAEFTVHIEIPLPGGLEATDGVEITTTTGETSSVITVTHEPIASDGTITIDTASLDPCVAGGHLTTANIMVHDTAAAATWTGAVAGTTLTLTSAGGATAIGETVTVTFTGAGGTPWVPDTGGEQVFPLTAFRHDTYGTAGLNILFDIGGRPVADFSASPVSAPLPATVAFTDRSSGSPVAWNWSFGDGAWSEQENPTHTYTTSGVYTVSLNATNTRGSGVRSRADYLDIYPAGTSRASTVISGLTITNCGGPQTVSVDTSILPAVLVPNTSVLEIHPPPDRGFSTITLYALNGMGFSRYGSIINGNPTGVHLVSEDIAPAPGFSPAIGGDAAFSWSADLPSYPCDAVIRTGIRERITPKNNKKLLLIADGNSPPAVPKRTAYTATMTGTGFPASLPVTIHASINPTWRSTPDPTSRLFLWRIADDGNSGQILPTTLRSHDPVKDLDHYEALSPEGMSTFGLSSFTGNNNPFQLIVFAISPYIEPLSIPVAGEGGDGPVVSPPATPAPAPEATPTRITILLSSVPEPVTMNLYTRADGLITKAASITSPDGFVTLSTEPGILAHDRDGRPLSSLTLTPVPAGDLPASLPGGAFTFSGRAYDLQPDGAVFSPGISLTFATPGDAVSGQDFLIKSYDRATGSWQDVATRPDPAHGTVTGFAFRSGIYAVFGSTGPAGPSAMVTTMPSPPAAPTPAAAVPVTAVSVFLGIYQWVGENVILVVAVLLLGAGLITWERKQRRGS